MNDIVERLHKAQLEVKRLEADLERAVRENDRLREEVERERMRLAACGVVALADTPESARQARQMHEDYRSASCDDVARRVDECMRLRTELADAIKTIDRLHDERRELMAECEAPRKDAERLRHLLTANPDEGPFIAVRKPNKWGIYHDEVLLADEAIYEIDRAMASSAEGGSNDR